MAKWICGAGALLFLLTSNGNVGLAKPPDLPVDLGADFEESDSVSSVLFGIDFLTGKFSVSLAAPWNYLAGWLMESAPARAVNGAAPGRPNAVCPPRDLDRSPQDPGALNQAQARRMFDIAERCLRKGDLDKARVCYEETHLLAPESVMGRQAMERLVEIQNVRIRANYHEAE